MAPRCYLWAMSVSRYDKALKIHDLFPKRQDGLCRCGCGAKLEGRRTSWASKACTDKAVEAFLIQKGDTQAIRKALLKRDKGVCQNCGLDTERARQECLVWVHWDDPDKDAKLASVERMRRHFMALGYPSPHDTWWQADHILPLVEGGTHRLDNLRTLCIVCHKAATKDLAARRARARRKTRVAELPLMAGL